MGELILPTHFSTLMFFPTSRNAIFVVREMRSFMRPHGCSARLVSFSYVADHQERSDLAMLLFVFVMFGFLKQIVCFLLPWFATLNFPCLVFSSCSWFAMCFHFFVSVTVCFLTHSESESTRSHKSVHENVFVRGAVVSRKRMETRARVVSAILVRLFDDKLAAVLLGRVARTTGWCPSPEDEPHLFKIVHHRRAENDVRNEACSLCSCYRLKHRKWHGPPFS